MTKSRFVWAARVCILLVLTSNLSAALPFVFQPGAYAWSFALEGVTGEVLTRSIGLLFLMWVVPYFPVLYDPVRYHVCLPVIVVQQLLGLAGELWMWVALPPGHSILAATGQRFILFDAAGLLLLLAAWAASVRAKPARTQSS